MWTVFFWGFFLWSLLSPRYQTHFPPRCTCWYARHLKNIRQQQPTDTRFIRHDRPRHFWYRCAVEGATGRRRILIDYL
uniref:Putative secreted protein n=1 Tax=Anopheles darlingi TaxID=43151 RepID=A0A2M4D5H9_ANODA